jgi:DNA transformation protein and related proteins
VLEQLRRTAADVRARSMFGGVGVYAGDRFFALMDDDTLYFKVDDATRGRFEARGMGPVRPGGEVMQYYEVPGDVLEDAELLAPWVEEAIAVAARARRGRSRR